MLAREDGALLTPTRARQLLAGGTEVLAIDPGDDGAAARRKRGHMLQVVGFRTLDDWDTVAEMVDFSRPLVVLLEDQFGGKSFGSSKEVTWTSGVLAGYLFAQRPPAYTVVHVAPATWQAAQRRRMGVYGVQLDRESGIELALRELSEIQPGAHAVHSKAKREGFASALGILLWWEGLVEQCRA